MLAASKHPLHHKNINVWKLLQYPVLFSINIRLLGEEADASLIILPIRRLRQNQSCIVFYKNKKKGLYRRAKLELSSRTKLSNKIRDNLPNRIIPKSDRLYATVNKIVSRGSFDFKTLLAKVILKATFDVGPNTVVKLTLPLTCF